MGEKTKRPMRFFQGPLLALSGAFVGFAFQDPAEAKDLVDAKKDLIHAKKNMEHAQATAQTLKTQDAKKLPNVTLGEEDTFDCKAPPPTCKSGWKCGSWSKPKFNPNSNQNNWAATLVHNVEVAKIC